MEIILSTRLFERHLVIEELRARLSKKPELLAQGGAEM
jgi:hypothetical protein